jgi:putative toxin-antitoxin system antitoxin component (TIGR02293 family)
MAKFNKPGLKKPVITVSVKGDMDDKPVTFSFSELSRISALDKINLIRKGLSKNNMDEIKKEAGLDYVTLSSLLSVSRAKLLSKKKNERFDILTSERIMLLGDVISYGHSVFEDDAKFNTWLRKPSKALGSRTPLELMDTVYGIEEIKKELGRIEYGVY